MLAVPPMVLLFLLTVVWLAPGMPYPSQDSEWALALSQAVADRLVFGRDVLFTLGPWGPVYTGQYHPGTDSMMLAGGTVVALALRLNLPAIQLVNYAVAPLQLLLIIPFVRLGEHLSGAVPEPLSIHAGLALLAQGVAHAVEVLWGAILHAALGWALLGPPCIALLYLLFRPLLGRVAARLQARGSASAHAAGP